MPAVPESSVEEAADSVASIKKLGVIAGAGGLPARLLKACDRMGIEVFVVGFDGQTSADLFNGRNHMRARLGAAGDIIQTLKEHQVRDLVMIGAIRRPSLAELKPDMRTAKFFAKVGLRALGDDGLLKALRQELEGEGFRLHGIQAFAGHLLAGEGTMSRARPQQEDWRDIERGLQVSRELGRLDIGQSVIVQEGIVLGVEAAEGTDELIRRCSAYRRKGGAKGVLVKTCKPGQDEALDLPAIGPETVQVCAEAGFGGIVIHAGSSLVLDPDKVTEMADLHGMFVVGLDPDQHI